MLSPLQAYSCKLSCIPDLITLCQGAAGQLGSGGHILLFKLCYALDAFFCSFSLPDSPFLLCSLPGPSLWVHFDSCPFAPSSSPVPTSYKALSSSSPLLLFCSPLLLPPSPDPLLSDVHISAHIKERDDILPTTTQRTFKCGLPATKAILLLHLSPSFHRWAAAPTSTLTLWTFPWVNFQLNNWAELIHPHSPSCQLHKGG